MVYSVFATRSGVAIPFLKLFDPMGTRFRSSFSIGLVALALALVAPLAYGQGNMGQGGPSLSPSDVTDGQIESAARIVVAMQQLQQKYRQQYGNPQNLDSSKVAEVRRKLMKEQQQMMSKKVKEEGMSMQMFQQIMQTARRDSTLRTEMRSAIMEMRKQEGGGMQPPQGGGGQ